MNKTNHNIVLLQIQEQLLETVNHLSKLKLNDIFSEEDDIDTKLQKSNRIIRFYAKYLQITEKIDQRTENILTKNPTQNQINEAKENNPEPKKNEKTLQISAKTADYKDIKIDQPTTKQEDKLFKRILNKKNQYGLPYME